MKRKDYMKLFVRYCKKHEIWFSICGDGSIDEITDTDTGESLFPCVYIRFGSKKAYEVLKGFHSSQKG